MIVVAIIGFARRARGSQFHQKCARNREAKRIVNDARQIDAAIDTWALQAAPSMAMLWDLVQAAVT